MTVENKTNKTAKQVMGSLTYDFSFDCLLNDPTEELAKQAIKAKISDGSNETQLTYGTDYTVALNSDGHGGTITVSDARDSSYTIVIYREYDEKQGSDFNDFNAMPAETVEKTLDKLTMITQQLKEEIDRSVKVAMTGDIEPDVLVNQVERIHNSIDNVDTVADDISNVNTVAGSISNVNAVGGNIDNVIAVDENKTNINAVNANKTNINKVANDIAKVADVADDLPNVDAALDRATEAAAWAKGTDVEVGAYVSGEHSAKTYAANAKTSAQQAALAVGQVGNGIIPVICCASSAPSAFTAYQVELTSDLYVSHQTYYYTKTSGSGSVADNVPIYSDKWCLHEAFDYRALDADPPVRHMYTTWGATPIEFEYTGSTVSNSMSDGDMYYNTTNNKIYIWDANTSTWGEAFTVNNTILVLDKNTNKLMHLMDGKLEGVYTL